jgi:phytoene dehydrogenase-like protein
VRGLYHGSCATHGGGGVNGIPGWQAFNMAKKDKAFGKK